MSSQVVAQLPHDARRIVVRGTSGSGKSTIARRISQSTGLPYLELDAVFHQPGWTELADDEFRSRVEAFTDGPAWVVDGNYRQIAPVLVDRADTYVVYDLPRSTVMRRLVPRTLRRAARGQELWNGNKERWTAMFSRDPRTSIMLWAWTTHAARHDELVAFVAAPPRTDLRIVHVRTVDDERLVYAGLVRGAVTA